MTRLTSVLLHKFPGDNFVFSSNVQLINRIALSGSTFLLLREIFTGQFVLQQKGHYFLYSTIVCLCYNALIRKNNLSL